MKTGEIWKKMLRDINCECNEISPRGKTVREVINCTSVIENASDLIFEYNNRKFSFKYLAAELLRYLSGSLDTKYISKYAKLRGEISDDEGLINSNYGYIVLHRKINDYNNQYNYILEKLKEDRDTRQAVMRYNSHEHVYKGNTDFVCTLSNQFFIRDKKLHMIVNMRSQDMFYGFQYDIVWFGLIMQSLIKDLEKDYSFLETGNIYYNIGSAHIYQNMFKKTNDILREDSCLNYNVKLNTSLIKLKEEVVENVSKYREELEKTTNYRKFIEEKFSIKIN